MQKDPVSFNSVCRQSPDSSDPASSCYNVLFFPSPSHHPYSTLSSVCLELYNGLLTSLLVDKLSRSILGLQLTQSLGSTYTADRSLFLRRILHLASETKHSWFLPPGLSPLCWLLVLGLLLLCLPQFPKQTSSGLWLYILE